MERLTDFCLRVKVIAVELASLIVFLGILAFVVHWEWIHLFPACTSDDLY